MSLTENLLLVRDFLHTDFRKTILLCTVGLLLTGLCGYWVGISSPETVETVINAMMDSIEQSGVIVEEDTISTFSLLAHNWTAMLLDIVYGLLPFVFLPVSSLLVNGFILGITGAMSQLYDQTLSFWLAAILPHGIFELTALVLSVACGIYVCYHVTRRVLAHPNRASMTDVFCDVLRVLLFLIAPLTIAAAFIEAYLTPLIMALFV